MRTLMVLALALVFVLASTITALSTLTPSEGLKYSVRIIGMAEGEGKEWINVTGEITYHIRAEGPREYAVPEPLLSITYSEGIGSVDNAGFSVSTLRMKLESTEEFEIKDPFGGVLDPVFLTSISDLPAILSSACGAGTGVPESNNITTTAGLTTYEGRDSLEFFVLLEMNYADGSSTKIITHSIIDLSTLEPLYLENNLTKVLSNCTIEVGLRAVLENTEELPIEGVHEFRVVTSRGDAIILIAGTRNAEAPVLSGEDSVSIRVEGDGRMAVIVAHTPSSGAPKIVINSKEIEGETYLHSLGTAYTIRVVPLDGGATIDVVFENARVALPWTETLPETGFPASTETADTSTNQGAEGGSGGIDPIPYILGGVIAAILGILTYLVLRHE